MSIVGEELERAIREALRSRDLAASDLMYPTLQVRAVRTRSRTAAMLAAAGVVAVVAVLLAVVLDTKGHRPSAPGADSMTGVVGYRWRVTDIVDSQGELTIPASIHAEVGYTSDGYVLGDDTVNPLQANYTPTADGYTIGPAIIGAVGSTGLDPARERTLIAVDSLFFSLHSEPVRTPSLFAVTVKINGDGSLTLQHEDIQVRLTRTGRQPDFFTQPPSLTPTASH